MVHLILDILKNSILITGLVVVMMMMIESLNIESNGRFFGKLKKNKFGQVVTAALLGSVPGCMGGFATVSLYTHGMFSFGALVAMMIASSGDEAFVMLAMFPGKAAVIFAILFVLSIIVGVSTDAVHKLILKKKGLSDKTVADSANVCSEGYEVHTEKEESAKTRHFGWKRAVILLGTLLFALALGFGMLEHDHNHEHDAAEVGSTESSEHGHDSAYMYAAESCKHYHEGTDTNEAATCCHTHDSADTNEAATCCHTHEHEATHDHGHALKIDLLSEGWMNVLFACLCVIMLAVIALGSDHFVEEHLWHHIICKHLPSIFLWTFGVLAAIGILTHFINIESWVSENTALMILLAVAIGIIPESGPHLIFVTLYASGILPFPVLLASCISQDGHAALPLLAETPKGFLAAKAINCAVALICGFAAMALM